MKQTSSIFDPEFYPTPPKVAQQMVAKLSKDAVNVLEPSAGRGDLAEAIREHGKDDRWGRNSRIKVDCIESDPDLAHVLSGKEFPVVGFDWLTYDGVCYYDAIVMNPPFSNGDDHLLRAWDFLHDGEIVCLLNEETIKNPHTAARQRLAEIISKHGTVEYLGDCFKAAARGTAVQVAMVHLKKESEDDRIEVWATGTGEKKVDGDIGDSAEQTMLAIRDTLGNMEHYYNMANEHMLKAFLHMRKASLYLEANQINPDRSGDDSYGHIVALAFKNLHAARAEFARKHRRDAWFQVFDKMEFHKWLDHKQREELLRDVERDCNIPFTAANIQGTLDNVVSQRRRLFEQSVANVFDELTRHFKGNTTSEGWKTNDNYKVNEKLIFPYGLRYESQYRSIGAWGLHYGSGMYIYADLDRVLCVLSGRQFEGCDTVGNALDSTFKYLNQHSGHSTSEQQAQSAFFDIRFYKKGTVHLKFRDHKLMERFNLTAAAGKRWLGQNTNDKSEFPGRAPIYNASQSKSENETGVAIIPPNAEEELYDTRPSV